TAGAGGRCAANCNQGPDSGLTCCGDACRNLMNDPKNCGMCGKACPDSAILCENGQCTVPACIATSCVSGSTCCGASCCSSGQLCCDVFRGGPQPIGGAPNYTCADPVDGTCPVGCPLCL